MRAPYKIVCDEEPGGADVVQRDTGLRIGYLRQDYYGDWQAFLSCAAGVPLHFGTIACNENSQMIWGVPRRPVFATRYRKDAARRVWDACQELVG